jgi:hypothetical protein
MTRFRRSSGEWCMSYETFCSLSYAAIAYILTP